MLAHSPSQPGEAVSVDAFLDEARTRVDHAVLQEILRHEDRILAKIEAARDAGFDEAPLHARQLLCCVRSACAAGSANRDLPVETREAAVALDYLLRGADLIPDSVEEIGLSDDASILARVVERNPAFSCLSAKG